MPRDGESVESAIESGNMSEDTVDNKSAKEMQGIGQVHDADDEGSAFQEPAHSGGPGRVVRPALDDPADGDDRPVVPGRQGDPVQRTARRVHHILSSGGDEDTIISAYLNDAGIGNTVSSAQMRSGVRNSVKELGLHKNGIDADLVGVHSLRAGGAMAMKLRSRSETQI